MKKLFVVFVMSAAAICAQTAPVKKSPAKAVAPAKADGPGLPTGAVADGPYTWKYTDAKGGKWIYRQTPFGLVKMEDKPAPVVVDAEVGRGIKVDDLGDRVHFERATPFGQQSWTKKKTELTDEEKAFMAAKSIAPVATAEKQ